MNLAGGSLTEGKSEYLVRVANQFLTPAEIGDVILSARPQGLVRVSDVARVARGARGARRGRARRRARSRSRSRSTRRATPTPSRSRARVKRRVAKLSLPAEMKLLTVADQSRFIERSIGDVTNAALMGGLLSILVIFAFLREWRSTLIISLSIPISVFATFVIMYRMGLSLNLMSLGGLALGVGMLVDDSIVVLESIFRTRAHEPDPRRAAARGTAMVAMAVTASTLTTIVVFLPLVFVEGVAGQLIRDQALTITFSLLASLGVALVLVPTIAAFGSRCAPRPRGGAGRRERGPVGPRCCAGECGWCS